MSVSEQACDRVHALKCELADEVIRGTGYLKLRVTGWSMLPSIWPGDTLELERANCCQLSPGDIVLFRRNSGLCVHRVFAVCGNAVLTQGDAMRQPDPLVPEHDLLGRVTHIVRGGKIIRPAKALSPLQYSLAKLARSSHFGARVVVGIHGLAKN